MRRTVISYLRLPSKHRRICCISILLSLFLLPVKTYAAFLEVRAGGGGIRSSCFEFCNQEEARGSYEKAGINAVFTPWSREDIYVGVEYTSAHNVTQYYEGNTYIYPSINYSLNVAALDFGLRFKFIRDKKVNLYFMMGGLAGKAFYKVDSVEQADLVLLSGERGSKYFIVPQVGVGATIGVRKNLRLGVEVVWTAAVPDYTFSVYNSSTGQAENRKVNSGDADMLGFMLEVQYFFDK